MEHHSNIVPWHFHRERKGAVLKWVDVDDDGSFSLEAFERALTPRTKIVAITQMSNVLGTAPPIKEIVRIAHARGVPVLVDGSQGAVHLDVDVRDLDVDFYVFTGHKVYGPTGIGVLYGKRGAARIAAAVQRRRRDDRRGDARRRHLQPAAAPLRGRHAADRPGDRARRRARLYRGDRPGADSRARGSAYAPTPTSGSARSIRCASSAPRRARGRSSPSPWTGAHAHDVATVIDRSGVAVRAGTHCAMPLLQRFGVTSTCRASFALYNTRAEVDALADALTRAQKLFG